jgi:hypothetical protein
MSIAARHLAPPRGLLHALPPLPLIAMPCAHLPERQIVSEAVRGRSPASDQAFKAISGSEEVRMPLNLRNDRHRTTDIFSLFPSEVRLRSII